MTGSYLSWIAFTIGAYLLLGGEGGLMDGFLLVLYLCFTAMISSLVFLIGWLFYPSRNPVEEEVLIEPWA